MAIQLQTDHLTDEEYWLLGAALGCFSQKEPIFSEDLMKLSARLFGKNHQELARLGLARLDRSIAKEKQNSS